jgi:hypothetical protein
VKHEAKAVGVTAGSRQVPGRKPVTRDNNNNNNNTLIVVVNPFDLLLKSGLNRRPPHDN